MENAEIDKKTNHRATSQKKRDKVRYKKQFELTILQVLPITTHDKKCGNYEI